MSNDARAAKKALRKQIHERLSALDESTLVTQSQACQQTITSMRQYEEAKRIAIYLAMPHGEMRTDGIVRDAFAKGKKVFVPYLYSIDVRPETRNKRKAMTMLRLESEHEYANLPRDSWGIPSLPAESTNARENAQGGRRLPEATTATSEGGLDLIVVPGVAFDANMGRLGHGGGFYDRFLSQYHSSQPSSMPFLVGLCLQEQLLPAGQIAMETWDWKMDAIVDGTGKIFHSSKAL